MVEATDAGRETLRGVSEQLGLSLDDAAMDRLQQYIALLLRWNATYNLTAVRDPGDMLLHHIADCLAVVAPLRRQLASHPGRRVLDVGSGGGLPGVVIAAACDDVEVVCVDTVGKKAAFIRQAALELRLANLERLRDGSFDMVTSRAFASLNDFVTLTQSQVGDSGCWMAMKGKRPDREMAALPADIAVFHVEQLSVPGLDAERCLVWLRPRSTEV
jgi:16S rRNA (guanine527-N7)-methyltransferase